MSLEDRIGDDKVKEYIKIHNINFEYNEAVPIQSEVLRLASKFPDIKLLIEPDILTRRIEAICRQYSLSIPVDLTDNIDKFMLLLSLEKKLNVPQALCKWEDERFVVITKDQIDCEVVVDITSEWKEKIKYILKELSVTGNSREVTEYVKKIIHESEIEEGIKDIRITEINNVFKWMNEGKHKGEIKSLLEYNRSKLDQKLVDGLRMYQNEIIDMVFTGKSPKFVSVVAKQQTNKLDKISSTLKSVTKLYKVEIPQKIESFFLLDKTPFEAEVRFRINAEQFRKVFNRFYFTNAIRKSHLRSLDYYKRQSTRVENEDGISIAVSKTSVIRDHKDRLYGFKYAISKETPIINVIENVRYLCGFTPPKEDYTMTRQKNEIRFYTVDRHNIFRNLEITLSAVNTKDKKGSHLEYSLEIERKTGRVEKLRECVSSLINTLKLVPLFINDLVRDTIERIIPQAVRNRYFKLKGFMNQVRPFDIDKFIKSRNKFYISTKLDGRRKLMLCCDYGTFLVGIESGHVRILNMFSKYESISIFDVEKVKKVIYAIDCLVIDGKDITGETFENRRRVLSGFTFKESRQDPKTTKFTDTFKVKEKSDIPIITIKQFEVFDIKNNMQVTRYYNRMKSVGNESDGIIFQENEKYKESLIFKWKPNCMNTVDFFFPFGNKVPHYRGSGDGLVLEPFTGKFMKSMLNYLPHDPTNFVVECYYNKFFKAYTPLKIRYDKVLPNFRDVIEQNKNLMERPFKIYNLKGGGIKFASRIINNVKSITLSGLTGKNILDIGGGQGGDINKWLKHKINSVIVFEIDHKIINTFLDRLSNKRNIRTDIRLIPSDFNQYPMEVLDITVDAVTCFFATNFIFPNLNAFMNQLANLVSERTIHGFKLVIMANDGTEYDQISNDKSPYGMTIKKVGDYINIDIPDTYVRDVREYAFYFERFINRLREYFKDNGYEEPSHVRTIKFKEFLEEEKRTPTLGSKISEYLSTIDRMKLPVSDNRWLESIYFMEVTWGDFQEFVEEEIDEIIEGIETMEITKTEVVDTRSSSPDVIELVQDEIIVPNISGHDALYVKERNNTYFVLLYELITNILVNVSDSILLTYEGEVEDLYCMNFMKPEIVHGIEFLTIYGRVKFPDVMYDTFSPIDSNDNESIVITSVFSRFRTISTNKVLFISRNEAESYDLRNYKVYESKYSNSWLIIMSMPIEIPKIPGTLEFTTMELPMWSMAFSTFRQVTWTNNLCSTDSTLNILSCSNIFGTIFKRLYETNTLSNDLYDMFLATKNLNQHTSEDLIKYIETQTGKPREYYQECGTLYEDLCKTHPGLKFKIREVNKSVKDIFNNETEIVDIINQVVGRIPSTEQEVAFINIINPFFESLDNFCVLLNPGLRVRPPKRFSNMNIVGITIHIYPTDINMLGHDISCFKSNLDWFICDSLQPDCYLTTLEDCLEMVSGSNRGFALAFYHRK